MGKKYIIELEDKPFHNGNGDFLYRVKGFNSLVFDMTGVGKLTPYTEPDLDAIKQEEYEKGYKTAKVQCDIQTEKDLREVGRRHYQKGYQDATVKISSNEQAIAEKAYQRGLNDAWDAARKIWDYDLDTLKEIFGKAFMRMDIYKSFTASEAIEKIRQYEQEKEEIKVGDEVNAPFGKAIVVNIDSVAEKIWLVYADGHGGFEYFKDAPTKTGRRFPEIAEVLAKMKENNDNK